MKLSIFIQKPFIFSPKNQKISKNRNFWLQKQHFSLDFLMKWVYDGQGGYKTTVYVM